MDKVWIVFGVIAHEPRVMVFDHQYDAVAFMAVQHGLNHDSNANALATNLRCAAVSGVDLFSFDLGPVQKLGWVQGLLPA